MPIIHEEPIGGNRSCPCRDAIPWLALHDAERQLTDAEQHGDDLAVASARHAVEDARLRCAALVAELLLHAVGTDGIRGLLARVVNQLEPIDQAARDQADAVARSIEHLPNLVHGLRSESWELARGMIGLEARVDALELEGVTHG